MKSIGVVALCVLCFLGQELFADDTPPPAPTPPPSKEFVAMKAKAEKGDVKAQSQLGLAYSEGTIVAKDPAEAVKWWMLAAQSGNANAQNNLGVSYAGGYGGLPTNAVEAVNWFTKAAEQGVEQAQYALGLCYTQGQGVQTNAAQAVKWFTKSANKGNVRAQYYLGYLFHSEDGNVKQDLSGSVKWYRKAAEQEFAAAQYNLGLCYAQGEGVRTNYVEAHKWINLATAQAYPNSEVALSTLEQRMKRDDIIKAKKLAREFNAEKEKQAKR